MGWGARNPGFGVRGLGCEMRRAGGGGAACGVRGGGGEGCGVCGEWQRVAV